MFLSFFAIFLKERKTFTGGQYQCYVATMEGVLFFYLSGSVT